MRTLLDKDGVLLDPSTIRFERLLPGPIERVWAYLTESDKRKQWFAGGEYELRKGGKAHLFFQHKNIANPGTEPPEQFRKMHDEGHHWDGEILEVDTPRMLKMTFGEHSEVTYELTEQSNGEVLLTLTHRKLTADDLKNVAPGWHAHLAILADRLNNRADTDFWMLWQELHRHYADKLAK
ncbi:MAG: SRPBCC family protein [Xanthobacteraceae bacterium]